MHGEKVTFYKIIAFVFVLFDGSYFKVIQAVVMQE